MDIPDQSECFGIIADFETGNDVMLASIIEILKNISTAAQHMRFWVKVLFCVGKLLSHMY